jgi:hypothetical protein
MIGNVFLSLKLPKIYEDFLDTKGDEIYSSIDNLDGWLNEILLKVLL